MVMLETNQRLAEHFDSVLHTRYPDAMADVARG